MAEGLDLDAMLERFRDRAEAVKKRNLPPVGGEERQLFLAQAQADYQDFAIIGDAEASLEDGILILTIDLRPPDKACPTFVEANGNSLMLLGNQRGRTVIGQFGPGAVDNRASAVSSEQFNASARAM
ncbi:MAG: hypothetical protein OXH61_01945 [Acidimicrobiaceae bacterium]|nr:hypothetical protein [Acidimicrobiaceae bacterium]